MGKFQYTQTGDSRACGAPLTRPFPDESGGARRARRSGSVKRLEDLLHAVSKDDRPAVRAAHRAAGLGELVQQPVHLALIERSVDLDSGMAGDRGCNLAAQIVGRETAKLA